MRLRKTGAIAAVVVALGTRAAGQGQTQGSSQGPTQSQGPWLFAVSLRETYDTNVRFRSDPDPDDFVTTLDASLSRAFRSTRNDLSLSTTVGRLFYLERDDLNRWTFAGGVSLVSRLSPRTQLTASDAYSSNYTDQVTNLVDDGAPLPQSAVRRNRARLGLAVQLSPSTSLDLVAFHDLNDYEDPVLVDGKRFGAVTTATRRFSANKGATASYEFQRNNRGGAIAYIHTPSLGWSQALGSRVQLGLTAGVSYVDSGIEGNLHPIGSATLNMRFQRGSAGLGYVHRIRQNFGLGRETNDHIVSATLLRSLGPRLAFDASYTYVHSTDAFDPTAELDSQGGQVGLRFEAAARLSLFAGYVYQRRSQPTNGGSSIVSAHRPTIQGSYSIGW